jgi:hypothetical protein
LQSNPTSRTFDIAFWLLAAPFKHHFPKENLSWNLRSDKQKECLTTADFLAMVTAAKVGEGSTDLGGARTTI